MSSEKSEQEIPHEVQDKDSMKELIEKNIKWSQVIYAQNKRINKRLTMMVLGSYLRFFLIITPLILGLIYLPPLIRDFLQTPSGKLLIHVWQGSPNAFEEFLRNTR